MKKCLTLMAAMAAGAAFAFVKVDGTRFVDESGKEFSIRGVNLGHWLLPEGYMFGFSKTTSPNLIDLAFRQLVGDEATARFWKAFKANYITEEDLAFVAKTGANTVRLPLNYRLFTSDVYLGEADKTEGYRRIDDVVGWCRKHGLRLIIDMHACPGGQTGYNIDDSFGYPWLFESATHRAHYRRLWREIASRYADESVVLGYDLMNEPISSRLKDCAEITKKLAEVQLEAARAVREVDRNHVIFFAGGQWNSNFKPFEGLDLGENAAFTCHHYAFGDPKLKPEDVTRFVKVRDRANVPMYMGETGHNCTNWYHEIVHVMETNNIGWTFWPLKMPQGSCWNAFPYPKGWNETIVPFVETNRASYADIQAARPDRATAERLLMEYAENSRFRYCTPDRAYLKSIGLDLETGVKNK